MKLKVSILVCVSSIICSFYLFSIIGYQNVLTTFHGCVHEYDEDRNVVEIIESRGLNAEIHYVTTDDGYIIEIHRIINSSSKVTNKRPIILTHPLLSSGIDWLVNAPGLGVEYSETYFNNKIVSNNLGFGLCIFDYDVWLINVRGNVCGTNHTTLDPETDAEFWQFSFDEIIKYDLPAIITHILQVTKRSTVAYVGHSQGTLIMFGLLSEQPEYARIIQPFIALAPATRLEHTKTLTKYPLTSPPFMSFLYHKGGAFWSANGILNILGKKICSTPILGEVCSQTLFLFAGFDEQQLNKTRMSVYIAHTPAGTSAWNILHYAQIMRSKQFRKFDFGEEGNVRRYGTRTPPEYNLLNITKSGEKFIALLHSRNDYLADEKDVKDIYDKLKDNLILDFEIAFEKWNHLDFIWGLQASKYVNLIVIKVLEKFRNYP